MAQLPNGEMKIKLQNLKATSIVYLYVYTIFGAATRPQLTFLTWLKAQTALEYIYKICIENNPTFVIQYPH